MTSQTTTTTTCTPTQKDVCAALDAAARKAAAHGEPATSKQCWFLAGLLIKADGAESARKSAWAFNDGPKGLTKREASAIIDELLAAAK